MANAINPWIPNQHGAWPMLILPPVLGTGAGLLHLFAGESPHMWQRIVCVVCVDIAWIVGYFAFFSWGLWIKIPHHRDLRKSTSASQSAKPPARSRRKREALRACVTYSAVVVSSAVIALLIRPSLAWWAFIFAPLVSVALWEAWHRRPRSLSSGISTVIAASVMAPISSHAAAGAPVHITWWWAPVLGLYFSGTIFFVKSMIRKKNDPAFLRLSVGFHLVCVLVALVWAVVVTVDGFNGGELRALGFGHFSLACVSVWLVFLVSVCALIRSYYIPTSTPQSSSVPMRPCTRNFGPRATQWTPKRVGMFEAKVTAALILALLV